MWLYSDRKVLKLNDGSSVIKMILSHKSFFVIENSTFVRRKLIFTHNLSLNKSRILDRNQLFNLMVWWMTSTYSEMSFKFQVQSFYVDTFEL